MSTGYHQSLYLLPFDHRHSYVIGMSEGADYIYHFCGPQCLEAWCKTTNAHGK